MPSISLSRLTSGHHKKAFKFSSPSEQAVDLQRGEMKPLKRRLGSSPRMSLESTKSSGKASIKSPCADPSLLMTIESPPLVCYGPPKDSTGALLSGLMHLMVEEEHQRFEKFTMFLQAEVLIRRPVQDRCTECTTMTDQMHTWVLIGDAVTLDKGTHSYPFSYLFSGHLPATNDNALSRISYSLCATAVTSDGDEVTFTQPIKLERSILPGPEKHSVRIFPPTNLSATVKLPSVVHLGGSFMFDIRLDGVRNRSKNTRWRLRKANWRIEETVTAVSPACKQHTAKLGGEGKGVLHEDVRTVGSDEIKRGWKSDFETADGKIEMEVAANLPAQLRAACAVQSPCGINVSHALIVEIIVAEEYQPTAVNRATTATGAARVLRMQFALTVTARSGLGISWDEEAPPMYEDVPNAPPGYSGGASPSFQYAEFPLLEEVPSLGTSYSIASTSFANLE